MQLIHRCHDAGISVTLYVMVGFPTETREEAEHTLSTILANRQKIQEVSVRVFYLDETSEIYRRAKEFDIQSIHADPEADLQVYYDFTPGVGWIGARRGGCTCDSLPRSPRTFRCSRTPTCSTTS